MHHRRPSAGRTPSGSCQPQDRQGARPHRPGNALSIIVVLVLIEAGREWVLTDDENLDFLLYFAFIPARYDTSQL